ncbi:MAG: hypothetical protein AAFX56_12760 [Pseudomonadota bacterium]
MNERLKKQWETTERVLNYAAVQIAETEFYQEYREFISHNELGLALDILEEAGLASNVDKDYWHWCKKASEIMELERERRDRFRALKRDAPDA